MSGDLLRGCKNIADYIGFSQDETQRKAFDGEIPAFKISGIWHMRKADWDALVDELAAKAAARVRSLLNSGAERKDAE